MRELTAERQVVKRALDQLGVQAWVFEEDAGARPTTIRQTYLDELSKSDLYIGLFWKSWGKYTVDEFRHAREKLRMDCLIYEKRASGTERETDLQQFLDDLGRVGSGITIQRFSDQQELDSYVRRDVAAWQAEKIHELGAARLDSPFQAPPLGDSHIERGLILQDLKRLLLAGPDGQGKRVTRAIVHGPPGVGKTIMASAFANDEDVDAVFPDGVLWLSLGETPDLLRRLTEWGRAVSDPQLPAQGYPDIDTAVGRLRSLMRDRAYLLVVDDVWMPEHIKKGFLIGGPKCLLLMTSRDGRIASKIRAERVELTPMTEKEAVELMSRWAGPISQEDEPIARTLAREVGYLPLALELIGARVESLSSWPAYREQWKEQRFAVLTRGRGSRGRQNSVSDSLELSLKSLPESDRQRYVRLGVFERKGLFPASAAATLWACNALEAQELLIDLAGQALLSRRETESGIRFGFHDLIYDFILEQLGSAGVLRTHETLLERYRRGHANWPAVPDDGYFLDNLSYHLIGANRGNELVQLLISSPDWMNAKVAALGSDSSLALDVDRALGLDLDQAQLVGLYAVKQAVRERLGWLTDTDLGTLVWQGRVAAALSQARMRPNPETRCGSLVAVYKELRASGDARPELLDEAAAVARQIGEGAARAAALQTVGTLYFSVDDSRWFPVLEEARGAADSAEMESARCLALLNLAVLVRRVNRDWSNETLDAAAAVAIRVPSNDKDRDALLATATAYARAGRPEDALQVLKATKPNFDPDDIADFLVDCWRAGRLSASLAQPVSALLGNWDEQARTTHTQQLSLFIRALTGDHEAYDVMLKAKDTASALADYRLEAYISKLARCLAAAHAEAGDFEGARRELENIGYLSHRADALEDLVQAASKAGYSRIAEIVLEEAQRGLSDYPSLGHLDYSIRVWRLLFRVGRPEEALALVRLLKYDPAVGRALPGLLPELDRVDAGNRRPLLEEADRIAHEIRDEGWRAEALRALALAFAKARDERADSISKEVWAVSSRGPRYEIERAPVRMRVADIFAVDGFVGSCRRIISSLGAESHVDGLCRLAWYLFDRDDERYSEVLEEAQEVASTITRDKDRVEALIMLVGLLGHVADPRWRTLTQEAEPLALSLPDSELRLPIHDLDVSHRKASEALGRLADALTEAKQFDKALDITGRIPDNAIRAQRRAHIAKELAKAGDPRSDDLFRQAKDILPALRYAPGDRAEYTRILIFTLAGAGRIDEAIEVARIDFREADRSNTLMEFTRTLIEAGRLEDAWEIAHSIALPSQRARALVDLALALTGREPTKSRTLLEEVHDSAQLAELPDRKSSILYQTARGFARIGRITDAERVAETIIRHDFCAGAFREIADAVRETNPGRAEELLRQALAEAHLISDPYQRHREVTGLADTLARVHGIRRGLEALETDSLDEFIDTLTRWAPLFDQQGMRPSTALRSAIAIAAWVRSDWKEIHDYLTEPDTTGS